MSFVFGNQNQTQQPLKAPLIRRRPLGEAQQLLADAQRIYTGINDKGELDVKRKRTPVALFQIPIVVVKKRTVADAGLGDNIDETKTKKSKAETDKKAPAVNKAKKTAPKKKETDKAGTKKKPVKKGPVKKPPQKDNKSTTKPKVAPKKGKDSGDSKTTPPKKTASVAPTLNASKTKVLDGAKTKPLKSSSVGNVSKDAGQKAKGNDGSLRKSAGKTNISVATRKN